MRSFFFLLAWFQLCPTVVPFSNAQASLSEPKARTYLANHGSQNIFNTFIHSDLHELLFMQLLVDDQHELNMRYSQDQMLTALEEMYITATPTEFLAVKTELGTMAIVKGDSLHITKKQYQTLFAQIATFTRDKASAIEGIDPTVFVKLAITTCIPLEEAVEALLLKNFPDTKTLIRFVMGSPGKTGFIGFLVPMKYKPSDVGATKENPINKSTPYQYGYQHPRAAGGQQQHPEHMAAASTSLDPHVDKCPSCWGPHEGNRCPYKCSKRQCRNGNAYGNHFARDCTAKPEMTMMSAHSATTMSSDAHRLYDLEAIIVQQANDIRFLQERSAAGVQSVPRANHASRPSGSYHPTFRYTPADDAQLQAHNAALAEYLREAEAAWYER